MHDIITLHLADTEGVWKPSYSLSKTSTPYGFLGSSAERRARELAEDGKHIVNGNTYFIEKRMNGKYAEYRVASTKKKSTQNVTYNPDGTVSIWYN